MKKILVSSLAAALMTCVSAQAATVPADALDFHQFEASFGRTGEVPEGYAQVRDTIPAGLAATDAVALLRHAGAHCQSTATHKSEVECYYREEIGIADYSNTYATWDMHIQLSDGKVAALAIERTTDQH